MKRYFILFTIVFLVPFFSQAQDLVDALRFSNFGVAGTARSGAMGNAFGALGGDFTSASINPAGIGLYRSGEFAFTPKSSGTNTEASYWGSVVTDNHYKFALSNVSYVSAVPVSSANEAGLVSVNLGIGYNRLKDFGGNSVAYGRGTDGSYMDFIADNANNGIWSDYYEELAWKTDMLIYDEGNNVYFSDLEDAGYGQSQKKTISRTGYIGEYSFTVGLNFSHKLYLGAGVGMQNVYYLETTSNIEVDENGNIPYFNDFGFNTYLRTNGYGNNFKFGAIYKPVNQVRLGVSVHTPTFFRLKDLFNTSMNSYISYNDGSENYEASSPYSDYHYQVVTPMRATFSGAFLISNKGLISVDYELVNYANAKLRNGGDGYGFTNENMEITEAYKNVGNLRLGGELRVNEAFTLRGGYQFSPSPYNSNAFGNYQPNSDANSMAYSAGLGYRSGMFFFDLAYRYITEESNDLLYPEPDPMYYPTPQMAQYKVNKNNVMFTVGFKF